MKAQLFRGEKEASPLVVLNAFENEGKAVFKAVRSLTNADFSLLEVSGMEWNRDLSPWEAPAVFKNDAPFGGKADDYLKELGDFTTDEQYALDYVDLAHKLGASKAYLV